MSERLPVLLQWVLEHGIQIDDSIRLVDAHSGISVISTDKTIHPATTIVFIPKSAILSARSCSLAPHIPFAPYGHDAHLALSVAVYAELLRGSASHWYEYLQSLPARTVPLALFWGMPGTDCDDKDGREAKLWLANSQVEKEFVTDAGTYLLDDIRNYYHSVAKPLLDRFFPNSLSGFLHAYSLVSSRAFLVDAYHGLSMVPIADAFNHITENHVHLESDFDVCPICGSLGECPHDKDEQLEAAQSALNISTSAIPAVDRLNSDTCEMVANRHILPHSEIYNTYGSHLSNAALLARYGFALEGNENDVISWRLPVDIVHTAGDLRLSSASFMDLFFSFVKEWSRGSSSMILEESSLVYQPSFEELERQEASTGSQSRTALCINSDAQISVHLWLLAALHCIVNDDRLASAYLETVADGSIGARWKDVRSAARILVQAMQEQVRMERLLVADDEDDDVGEKLVGSEQALMLLKNIAQEICSLCNQRAAIIGKRPDLSVAELGELFDELDDSWPKTRLAVTQVILERSLLESCAASWQELGGAITDD
ncbi:SET domain-containing protein [Obba rivulosa]|uniref:SET domain-containing protein n=1 Tax=Obba rivulosa TaxID=1052685 RepID=A0A8E2AW18_9APHY|nr:SET domain-containing protein [Obba rivulosa]